ncbi:MAG TPA: hypothetical protein DHU56_02985 [Marinobacter sp.]|nr:hypothetical protein [Marinobacter sp.]
MADFHFLRPLWLLLWLAVPLLPLLYRYLSGSDNGWQRIIPGPMLQPLIRRRGESGGKRRPILPMVMLSLALLSVALAGPTWRKAPSPLQQQDDSLVIVLDLSLSMLANDLQPDRLTRAKRKIRDLLAERQASLTALVVYAADAHTVTPLTSDRATIESMVGVLDPLIMPAPGNRADLAVSRAIQLLEQGAPGKGRILLISDQVAERYQQRIRTMVNDSPYTLSTLVAGTREGAPIPLPEQGFVREGNQIVLARATPEELSQLALSTGGQSHRITVDNQDIQSLALRSEDSNDWRNDEQSLTVDRWKDDGYWLLWLALVPLLISWRRGALLLVTMAVLVLPALLPRPAMALEWADLWKTPEQRAPELIEQNPEAAADKLKDPEWRGLALYRAGKYEAAARVLAKPDTVRAQYNRANALARAGKLQQALDAYEQVLAEQPDHADARYNRDLIKELLKQQKKQQEQQDKSGKQADQQNSRSSSQSGDNSRSDGSQSSTGDSSKQQQNGQPSPPGGDEEQPQSQEQQSRGGQDPDGQEQQPQQESPAALNPAPLSQSQEQWLRRVPDNPGGLLQRKFLQQYQQRGREADEEDTPW